MKGFFSRLKEPSTWAGFAILGSLFGIKELSFLSTPEMIGGITTVVGGLAAVFLKEKPNKEG